MQLAEKVKDTPFIYGIELDFSGHLVPVSSESGGFFNSKANQLTWEEIYFGRKTVSFKETTKTDKRGNTVFSQFLTIKFPSNDFNRANRLALFFQVRFLKILLTNKTSLVFGRNDFYQNKPPAVSISSSERMSSVSFESKSIFPTGFAEIQDISQVSDQLLPADLPLTFINL
ncbi:hypothetical protein [Flavicella sp.]|uniref:hypothetical protein n=1 Tax=Flavicella sp. TaxID=2957742 RepID=UPI00301B1B22